jgi:hypothetical protein
MVFKSQYRLPPSAVSWRRFGDERLVSETTGPSGQVFASACGFTLFQEISSTNTATWKRKYEALEDVYLFDAIAGAPYFLVGVVRSVRA